MASTFLFSVLLLVALVSVRGCALNNVGNGTCTKTSCGKLLGYFQDTNGGFNYGDGSKAGGTNYEYYISFIPKQFKSGTTPMFQFISQVAASNVSECCSKCSNTNLCQLYRYFPSGATDNFQSISIGGKIVGGGGLLYNYPTPFPPCWPNSTWCPGYDLNDGTRRCLLFKLETTTFKTNTGATCTSPGTNKCYPAVATEVSYTFAPDIVANSNIRKSDGTIKASSTPDDVTYYNGRPRSYWGGLCNPYVSTGTVNDDPHFVGGFGVRYDFNGQVGKSFALLTDKRVHINMVIGGYVDSRPTALSPEGQALRSWITAVSILWKDVAGTTHSLHLKAREGNQQERGDGFISIATMDGEDVVAPKQVGSAIGGGGLNLILETQTKRGSLDMDVFKLEIDNILSATISTRVAHPLLQLPREAFAHFNVKIDQYVPTDSVHGVLGQTLRADGRQSLRALEYKVLSALLHGPIKADGASGIGFLDGEKEDYMTSNPSATDCKFCVFKS